MLLTELHTRKRGVVIKTRLILIGGFLGSGKTTLLSETARILRQRGLTTGVITNDQAAGLVDTAFLSRTGMTVAEVYGSCFCCDFPGLTEAIAHLNQKGFKEIILAEPVGSCTDLSATVINPLKEKLADTVSTAPLSVLADPMRLIDILDGRASGMHPATLHILKTQLEEADLILINKTDLLDAKELESLKSRAAAEWPWAKVFAVSAKTGAGIEDWLDAVLRDSEAGLRFAEVDYDIYAEGEAVLGWLNLTAGLQGAADWDDFARELLNALNQRLDKMNAAIGHLKLMIETESGFVIGNITGAQPRSIRGSAGGGAKAKLTLNARVQMEPGKLKAAVTEVLTAAADRFRIVCSPNTVECLKPGRPNPTYRYGAKKE